jgi:hypothetical protein
MQSDGRRTGATLRSGTIDVDTAASAMTDTVTLPVWLAFVLALAGAWLALERVLVPSVR